jgi:uncharacterized protein YjbI with pentapeptide repeats
LAINYSRNIGTLRQLIATNYGREDIGRLCAVLGTDFERLPGETKLQKVNSLLTTYAQSGQLVSLVEEISKDRPDAAWVTIPIPKKDSTKSPKPTNGTKSSTAIHQNQLETIKQDLNESKLNKYLSDRSTRDYMSAMVRDGFGRLDSIGRRYLIKFLFEESYINNRNPILALAGADLSNTDLSWLTFNGACLSYVNFSNSDFTLANMSNANLSGSSLRGAQLKAFLVRTELVKADLREADLTGAQLAYANLAGSNLRFANLTGVDLHGANLTGVDLTFSNLGEADLSEANLTLATLRQTNLKGAIISDAIFDHADIKDVEHP